MRRILGGKILPNTDRRDLGDNKFSARGEVNLLIDINIKNDGQLLSP